MCVRAGPVTPNTDDIGARKGTRGHVARDDAAAREVSLTAHGAIWGTGGTEHRILILRCRRVCTARCGGGYDVGRGGRDVSGVAFSSRTIC